MENIFAVVVYGILFEKISNKTIFKIGSDCQKFVQEYLMKHETSQR